MYIILFFLLWIILRFRSPFVSYFRSGKHHLYINIRGEHGPWNSCSCSEAKCSGHHFFESVSLTEKKQQQKNTTCTVIHEFLGLVVTSFAQHIWSNVDGTKLHYLQVDGIFPILIGRLLVFLLPETARLTKPLKPNCLTRLGHLPSCPVGGTILTQTTCWCHLSFNRIKFPAQNFPPHFLNA